jgi:hypothetical protein
METMNAAEACRFWDVGRASRLRLWEGESRRDDCSTLVRIWGGHVRQFTSVLIFPEANSERSSMRRRSRSISVRSSSSVGR